MELEARVGDKVDTIIMGRAESNHERPGDNGERRDSSLRLVGTNATFDELLMSSSAA